MPDPLSLSVRDAAREIAAGRLSAEAFATACLDRIAAREPIVGAWHYLDRDAALAAARARDAEAPRGPLHGIPIAVKDLIDTADMPTGYGSPIYEGHRPAADAACVALARAAGAVVLGKTVTTEFACFTAGKTANPHNPAHTPGGSSSGSAAAVADGMVPLAFGSQTAGSTIRPAAYCGCVGYKPSFGMVPRAGVKALADSLDTIGIMARTVGDIMLFHAAIMAIPYVAPAMPETAPRLGLCRGPHWEEAEPEGRAALDSAAERLAGAGAVVRETRLPPECAAGDKHQQVLGSFEGLRNHMPELYRHEALLSARLRDEKIARGRQLTLAAFRAACRGAEAARAAAQQWVSEFDAILTLPAPGQAPRGLADTGSAVFNALWTQLYMPCLTLPAGRSPDGLPLGVQLVARRHADERLLQVALWVEDRLGQGGSS